MAKVLIAPDLHNYPMRYNRLENGVPSRREEWNRVAEALVKVARGNDVAAALFPGDLFWNSRPSPEQILAVNDLFWTLEDAGITVYACAGNHDLLGANQKSAVDLLNEMGPHPGWGITKPGFIAEKYFDLVVLPSTQVVKSGGDPAADAQRVSEDLMAIVRSLIIQGGGTVPMIVMGHWAVSGCRLAGGNALAASEPTLPLAELQALPVEAVVMGHIHTPQVLSEKPLVLHSGTLLRADFGEEKVACGCFVLDLDIMTVTWHPLPARRFVTLQPGVILDQPVQESLLPILEKPPTPDYVVADAIVRVCYSADERSVKEADHGAVIKALYDAGAHYVAGVFPEVIRSERSRQADITETTRPMEALERWLALQEIPEDMGTAVMAEAKKLLEEVSV